jgi:hypothetical protein
LELDGEQNRLILLDFGDCLVILFYIGHRFPVDLDDEIALLQSCLLSGRGVISDQYNAFSLNIPPACVIVLNHITGIKLGGD